MLGGVGLRGLRINTLTPCPSVINSMANSRFLRTVAKVLTMKLCHSVCHWAHALLAGSDGKVGLACSRGVPCCIPGLYYLLGSLRR